MNNNEIRDWLERAAKAPHADRDRLTKEFAAELERSNPELANSIRNWKRNGAFLAHAYFDAYQRGTNRADLSHDDRATASAEAMKFYEALYMLRRGPLDETGRNFAFDLAMNALFAGMRASPAPEELRKLHAEWKSADRREIGKKSAPDRTAKSETWKTYAAQIAKQVRAKNRSISQEDLADKIEAKWGNPGFNCPGRRTIVSHISHLECVGELPRRASKLPK